MSDRQLKIGKIRPCDCGQHSQVVLHECGGKTRVRVPVHNGVADWLAPDADGIRCLLTGFDDVLRGIGWEARAVVLTCDEQKQGRIWLRLAGAAGETDVECNPGMALLTASRIGLPIVLAEGALEAARTSIPEVFQAALEDLDLLEERAD